jgi:hypothetical protein
VTAVVVVVVVLLAVVAGYLLLSRGRGRRADQVDAFAHARDVTNRWSQDPSTTPAPLRRYLQEQAEAHASKDSSKGPGTG